MLTEHPQLPEVSSPVSMPCAAHGSTAGQYSGLCCLLAFHLGPGSSTNLPDSKKGGFLLSSDCKGLSVGRFNAKDPCYKSEVGLEMSVVVAEEFNR